MSNSDRKDTDNQSDSIVFLEETIQGLSEEELDRRLETLSQDQQDILHEGPEISLRPLTKKEDLSVDSSSIGQREIQSTDPDNPVPKQDQQVDYRVLELLGEGGMGQVHLAEQVALGRNVAVKQIRRSQLRESAQREFLMEASVTGKLEHPNIVPIYEVGQTHQGDLFYSMKNIQGQAWSTSMDEWSLLENLDILLNVCDALAFAHSQKVIHRDLKPDNIMIGGFGEVLVLDWGLAVILGNLSAASTAVAGTPAYMAPEMVNNPEQANCCSDVYLLGAILFRILAGHAPHGGISAHECLLAASRNEIFSCPVERLDKLDASGELLEIALRAIKANPDERFQSVVDLQQSIREFLMHRDSLELMARADVAFKTAQDSGDYSQFSRAVFGYEEAVKLWDENQDGRDRTEKARLEWASCAESLEDYDLCLSLLEEVESNQAEFKNRVLAAKTERKSRQSRLQQLKVVSMAASVLIAVLASGAAIWIDSERDKAIAAQKLEAKERTRADNAATLAKQEATRADQEAFAAKQSAEEAKQNLAVAERNAYGADMLLTQIAWERANLPRVHELLDRYTDREDLKGLEWNYFKRLTDASLHTIFLPNQSGTDIAFSPDGRFVSTGRKDGRIAFHDVSIPDSIKHFKSHKGNVLSVCFSPDGKYHASSGVDGRVVIRDFQSEAIMHEREAHKGGTIRVRFSPDSRTLASAGKDSLIKLWDAASGAELKVLKGHSAEVRDVAFSPDGLQLLSGSHDGTVRLWNLESGALVRSLEGLSTKVYSVAFHPDGKRVAAGAAEGKAMIWDLASGESRVPPFQSLSEIYSVEFSPNGRLMAYSGLDDRVHLVSLETGKELNVLRGHKYSIAALDFTHDNRRLASVSGDRTIKIWDVQSSPESISLPGHLGKIHLVFVSPDGAYVASAGADGEILVRETGSGQIVQKMNGHRSGVYSLDYGSEGQIVSGGYDKTIRVWDALSGESVHVLTGHQKSVNGVCLTPDGQRLISSDTGGVVKLWDLDSGRELRSYKVDKNYGNQVVVTPDGTKFGTCHEKGMLRLWDIETGDLFREFNGKSSSGNLKALTISVDGRLIATAGMDSTIRVWDIESGELLRTLSGHNFSIWSLAFNSDSTRLASASMDGTVKIWNIDSSLEALTLQVMPYAFGVDFHPDNQRIYTVGETGDLRIWDTRLWTDELRAESQARYLLNHLREESNSLEEMQSAIENDTTISDEAKQQARDWGRFYWEGQFFSLPSQVKLELESGNLEKALQQADRSRKSGPQTAQHLFEIAWIYSSCLPPGHTDEREAIRSAAKECLVAGFAVANFEQVLQVLADDRFEQFEYDREVLRARLEAVRHLWKKKPKDLDRIRHLAYSYYHSAIEFRRAEDFQKAIEYFSEAKKLHEQRVAAIPQEHLPYYGVIVSTDRLGQTYLDAGQNDLAVKAFEEAIVLCNQLIKNQIKPDYAKKNREILTRLKTKANQIQLATGDWKNVLKNAEKSPLILYYRAVELSKVGHFDEAMQACEKLHTIDPKSSTNLYNAACAYARCAELMLSPTEQSRKPSDPELPDKCLIFAVECLEESAFKNKNQMRNDSDLVALHGLKKFHKLIALEIPVNSESARVEWKASQEWIDDPKHKNHSKFCEQPNGNWLESGSDFSGKDFESRFTLHRKTPQFIELKKEGANLRVRLWPDKAFWGRVSIESGKVTKWSFLQNGSWLKQGNPARDP